MFASDEIDVFVERQFANALARRCKDRIAKRGCCGWQARLSDATDRFPVFKDFHFDLVTSVKVV